MALLAGSSLFNALQVATAPLANFESACSSLLSNLKVANTTIYKSQYVAGNSQLRVPDQNITCAMMSSSASPGVASVTADICRITGYTATSGQSGINWETWLPRKWTGRFISHGNGGLSGCIAFNDLDYSTSLGFAAVSANSGHNGTSGGAFYKNREVVKDFVWRSLHTGVVVGKEVTKSLYGKPHTKSYYLGCSTGGRQGFKAVQDWPEDFDGVIAGAPAFSFNNLTSWSGSFFLITGPPGSESYLSPSQWSVVHNDTLKQCDGLDGVVDGIIEDPSICNYDPSSLTCGSSTNTNKTKDCLEKAQVESVRKIYSALCQKDGSLIYPRLEPGSGYSPLLFNGAPFPFTTDWFRYVVYNDPNWDPTTLTLEDMAYSSEINAEDAETWKGDLSAFQNRGSKLIHFHGHTDFLISAANSARYYKHVQDTMGMVPSKLDQFYRYFPIAGLNHCTGGVGAYMVGQNKAAMASLDPKENVLTAIIRWVEGGIAPETITGTKYNNDSKANGIKLQRRHCRYPLRNKYIGGGADANKVESWRCE